MERKMFGIWGLKEGNTSIKPPLEPATKRKDAGATTKTGRPIIIREPIPGK